MKKYTLQKDLPNAKAGATYSITDDGENYVCYEMLSTKSWDVSYPKEYIENNPEWFLLKEDIELSKAKELLLDNDYEIVKDGAHTIKVGGRPFIFEKVNPIDTITISIQSQLKYTEEDLRNCFEKSRRFMPVMAYVEYKTFEDYIKSLKK